MNNKIIYTDGPIGEVEQIDDFLPLPDQLVFKEDTVQIMVDLSHTSLDFFKQEAEKRQVPYQLMIRHLLDSYALRHGWAGAPQPSS